MINHMDGGRPAVSVVAACHMHGTNASGYGDPRSPAYLYTSVVRLFDEVSIMVNFQNNPVARDSVRRDIGAMKSVFGVVAEARYAGAAVQVSR